MRKRIFSFLLRERRRNGKNKFSFIKVNHCFNSGIVNDGKYFKYPLYKRFKIPGSEKFFVNDLYFSALDCPTSTKVTRIIIQERSIFVGEEIVGESRENLSRNVSWIYYENKHTEYVLSSINEIQLFRNNYASIVSFSQTNHHPSIPWKIGNRIDCQIKMEFYNRKLDKNRRKQQKRLIIEMSVSIERPHIIAPAWIRLVAVHGRRSKTHRLRCFTREQGNNSGDYWLGSNIISPIGTRGGQSGRETRFPVSRWFVDDAINSI